MRFALLVLLVLLVAVAAAVFTIYNADPVAIDLYFRRFELPLATLVLGSMLLGVLIGLLLAGGVLLSRQAEVARLKRRYHALEMEVDNLRKIPIKEPH
ncbi:MAG: LapA family protein [Gammaproteobacteria bacterium]|nr:MAG: LapA family protein [Gammaproteobacteria bacterium]